MSRLNVNYIASTALEATYDRVPVQLYTFLSQMNTLGIMTVTFNAPFTIHANIQLANAQELQHIDGYNATKIYKKFWINDDQLTGLNRNISTGGDYISFNNLIYKIVQVIDNFHTNWIKVIGVEEDVINDT